MPNLKVRQRTIGQRLGQGRSDLGVRRRAIPGGVVFEPLYYSSLDTLLSVLDTEIIRPAEVTFDELIVRKVETMKGKHI